MELMKKIGLLLSLLLLLNCNKKEQLEVNEETIIKGETSVVVDESVFPITEDEVLVFESRYPVKIKLKPTSENEAIQSLIQQKQKIAILSRTLTDKEQAYFVNKKISPKITPFAEDAIVLINNIKQQDSLIAVSDLNLFMQGKTQNKIKGLVFDNLNSSTLRLVMEHAKVNSIPSKNVYSFKTNKEVIQFVAENEGMIGVLGYNWLQQPTSDVEPLLKKIKILNVKGINQKEYFAATQNNFAENKYPLTRTLYVVNCQGYTGLGMGLASFMAGEVGQRIILKSGLLPVHLPGRKIAIRNTIENSKN